jgi:phosphoribosylaminoimidazolecarboxamide formyltransferase / IMP cyclohydrolase
MEKGCDRMSPITTWEMVSMKQALISVYDKKGLIPFARALIDKGYTLISTGGTYAHLEQAGLAVTKVSDLTRFDAIMDGRVKTLHPAIHGGILGRRDVKSHVDDANRERISWIDLVVVNLYPFEQTARDPESSQDDIIKQIDIGGPAMIRSAAKNHQFVTTITSPGDYDTVIRDMDENGETSPELKKRLAQKAFSLTASYDSVIASHLAGVFPEDTFLLSYPVKEQLRYGENPHQNASFYSLPGDYGYSMTSAVKLHGKDLSYNNISDAQAALDILKAFDEPTAVAVKHMNPCGIGSAPTILKAFEKAYLADPVSIFGGIVAVNATIDLALASTLSALFLEVILAPSFDDDALGILTKKKNVRLIRFTETETPGAKVLKSIPGGLLVQDEDVDLIGQVSVPTVSKPSEKDMKELMFAYKAVKGVKSNAIVITKDFQTIGIGAGQMSRVGATRIALDQAKDEARDAYLASDAFIPMPDTIELAAASGVKAIIQPGGSIKDQVVTDLCDKHGIAMVMTNMRHFKH